MSEGRERDEPMSPDLLQASPKVPRQTISGSDEATTPEFQ